MMRWLQPDAALGELLCDKELKLHAGEIRLSVEDDMEDLGSLSSSCLLHCLCAALGGCLSACSEVSFCMLDWLSYRSEILPRYLFISGVLKNTRSSPPFTFDSSSLHGWQLSPPFEWWSDRPRPFVGFWEQLWLRAACRIVSHRYSGRVRCLNEFHQPVPLPPSLQPWGCHAIFRESFCCRTHGGCLKENLCTNQ